MVFTDTAELSQKNKRQLKLEILYLSHQLFNIVIPSIIEIISLIVLQHRSL